jgi:sugar phosphate isomerase/epimerase
MIYISSSSVQARTIKEAIEILIERGFSNIELSGGTNYYDGLEEDLFELKEHYKLNLLCHNYFPAHNEHFVLNLASLNNEIYQKSVDHYINAIRLSKKLGAGKYGLHAGYFVDIDVKEISKDLSGNGLFDKKKSMEKFCEGFNILKKEAEGLPLYIENNVLTYSNYNIYKSIKPFMLLSNDEYLELKKKLDFNLLLDIGHLKVSANSLRLDFYSQLEQMINTSDYIHLSENDGLQDQNRSLIKNSLLLNSLKKFDLKGKTITLEIYEDMENITESYKLISRMSDVDTPN